MVCGPHFLESSVTAEGYSFVRAALDLFRSDTRCQHSTCVQLSDAFSRGPR